MYKNQVDKDKKDAKILKRIINEISLNKIIKKHTNKKLLIYHGLIIQNYLIKLVMVLLVDTIKIKNRFQHYSFTKIVNVKSMMTAKNHDIKIALDIYYAIIYIRKIQHLKPPTEKIHNYLKKSIKTSIMNLSLKLWINLCKRNL